MNARWNWAFHTTNLLPVIVAAGLTLSTLLLVAPIVLVWVAFVKPQSHDAVLFSAAVLLTSALIGDLAQLALAQLHIRSYGDPIVTVVFASFVLWLVMAYSARRGVAAALCVLGLIFACALDYVVGRASEVDVAGGVLLGLAVLAFSVAVAERTRATLLTARYDEA